MTDQSLPRPHGICAACQRSAPALRHSSGAIAVYCPHRQAGGVLQGSTSGLMWTIYTPATREEFTDALLEFNERITFAISLAHDGRGLDEKNVGT